MIRSMHRLLLILLGVAALAVVATRGAEKDPDKKAGGPPPLRVDRSAPLLLDESGGTKEPPQGPVADNLACYCCHANYKEEPFAQEHAKANVGCVKCHGESYAHRNDEDNITPPDVMFPPERIAQACKPCHDGHDAPAVKVIARWREQCPEKTDPEGIVCTDCHGRHRLPARQVRWDKKTGKLLPKADPTTDN